MAIDIPRRQLKAQKKHKRTESKSESPVRQKLIELYKFLARRTDSKFNKRVAHRLVRSKRNLPPMSTRGLMHHLHGREMMACVVGTVTDDPRIAVIPKMSVCALKFSETARTRIEAAGGECLTFDQLALKRPTGENCVLLMGRVSKRKAERYFGRAPGLPHSNTRQRANPKASH